ncbi:MAG: gluconokinase [Saprospiraceae bacterium]|uniref:Gluconokinase n=1 Tax=Candidatus Opimibacter skivensis TaxID=2982028 RepID=A0A9D7SVL5_9BACT|nr:gluconokinase [Candidatus Opimibacter skivensis]
MQKQIIFVMGVSGSGKTTIGQMLADKLGIPFFDGDDYHPVENVAKMRDGIPLDDADRYSWLKQLHGIASEGIKQNGGVIACSALKESYRKILIEGIEGHVRWIILEGTFDLIKERLEKRRDHYMPVKLLTSQFDALEIPSYAISVSIESTPETIVENIINELEY